MWVGCSWAPGEREKGSGELWHSWKGEHGWGRSQHRQEQGGRALALQWCWRGDKWSSCQVSNLSRFPGFSITARLKTTPPPPQKKTPQTNKNTTYIWRLSRMKGKQAEQGLVCSVINTDLSTQFSTPPSPADLSEHFFFFPQTMSNPKVPQPSLLWISWVSPCVIHFSPFFLCRVVRRWLKTEGNCWMLSAAWIYHHQFLLSVLLLNATHLRDGTAWRLSV